MTPDTPPIDVMRKAELVALGARLGLGSRAALDARHVGDLRRDVRDALAADPAVQAAQPEPRSIAHNANARTGVYLGELRDV